MRTTVPFDEAQMPWHHLTSAVVAASLDVPFDLLLRCDVLVESDRHRLIEIIGFDMMNTRLTSQKCLECGRGAATQQPTGFEHDFIH